ncbi:hypothetical protein VC36_27690 [Pseudomonas marginalis]|nr:hypothetical protein VC36_27690 [Pseudomonas marginalis]KJZ53665.1 hypothetical protein VC37_16675 [Pseudomonas marginalis]
MCFSGHEKKRCFSMWRDVTGMNDPKPVVIANSLNWDSKFLVPHQHRLWRVAKQFALAFLIRWDWNMNSVSQ